MVDRKGKNYRFVFLLGFFLCIVLLIALHLIYAGKEADVSVNSLGEDGSKGIWNGTNEFSNQGSSSCQLGNEMQSQLGSPAGDYDCDPPGDVPEGEVDRYVEACRRIVGAGSDFREGFEVYGGVVVGSGVPGLGLVGDGSVSPLIKEVIDVMVDEMCLDLLHFSMPFSSVGDPGPWEELLEYAQGRGVETMVIAEDLDSDVSWGEYRELHLDFVDVWAGSVDYFMVVSDPTFPWSPTSRIVGGESVTVEDFAVFAQQAAGRAKAVNPNVTVLAGLPGRFRDTFPENHLLWDRLLVMPEFDVWSMYYFSVDDLYEARVDVESWREVGKEVWMLANYATPDRQQYYDNPWLDHLVGKFIDASIYYAELHNVTVWEWAWPVFFWTYREVSAPDVGLLQYRTDTGARAEYWARTYKNLTPKNYPYPAGKEKGEIRRWWLISAILFILLITYLIFRRS